MGGNPNPRPWQGVKVVVNEQTVSVESVDGKWGIILDSYTGKVVGASCGPSSSSQQPE